MNKLEDIEKVRGFSCLLVLMQHLLYACPYAFVAHIVPIWLSVGSGAVHVFFAISGFVVTLSLRDKINACSGECFLDRLMSAKSLLKNFYTKRLFRIAPVLLVTWIALGIFLWITEPNRLWCGGFFQIPMELISGTYNYAVDMYANIERVHFGGAGPWWTLAVESLFYCVWPMFLLMCKTDNARAIMSFCLGLFFLLIAQPISTIFWQYKYYAVHNNICELFFGAFFAYIYEKGKGTTNSYPIVTTLSMIILLFYIWYIPSATHQDTFFAYTTESVVAVLIVVLAIFRNGEFKIPLITDFFSYLGSRSYTFYVIQLTIASFIAWFAKSIYFPGGQCSDGMQFFIFLIVLFVMTEIVYNLVERPCRKLGRIER